jgi:tetraacyldisaccharide 4'-kinase
VERAWSGAPGTTPWTAVLEPVAALVAAASRVARDRAAVTRRAEPGLFVVAVGALTVGGTGKTSLARWLALEAAAWGGRAAVLLRGHGSRGTPAGPAVVPDVAAYPLRAAAARYGDEALAHRAALPRSVAVLVDRDRARAARAARRGYGAAVAILDDGWEQDRLAWDALWVALDPRAPAGNGRSLPAGPLRRPPATLAEAAVIAFVLEEEQEAVPPPTLEWVDRHAPRAVRIRFRRAPRGISAPTDPVAAPWPPNGPAAGLLTAVGAPERVERFARSAGIQVAGHVAFPDHAPVGATRLRAALAELRAHGAAVALVTEKDEHRWMLPDDPPIPVFVLRTELKPLDPVDAILSPFRSAATGRVS